MTQTSQQRHATAPPTSRSAAARCTPPSGGRTIRTTPTILAVHGVTASHKAWAYLAAALPDVRIIAPDLRGRGRSNSLPAPYGMPSHAEDLAAVLAELAPGPVVVVGHSMGGFAVARPGQPVPGARPLARAGRRRPTAAGPRRTLRRRNHLRRCWVRPPSA